MESVPAHEKLGAFLQKHAISKTEAGKAVGVTHAAVIGWLNGRTPDMVHRQASEIWTNGEVRADEWEGARAETEQLRHVRPFEPKTGEGAEVDDDRDTCPDSPPHGDAA